MLWVGEVLLTAGFGRLDCPVGWPSDKGGWVVGMLNSGRAQVEAETRLRFSLPCFPSLWQMTEVLNVLETYLHHRKWDYCRIDGGVKVRRVTAIVVRKWLE